MVGGRVAGIEGGRRRDGHHRCTAVDAGGLLRREALQRRRVEERADRAGPHDDADVGALQIGGAVVRIGEHHAPPLDGAHDGSAVV